MDITALSSIKPFSYNYRIRVRICRTWRAIKFGEEKYNGFHCVMVDQQGSSIHGFMPEDQVEDMNEQPVQGQIYDIYQFSTKRHSYGLCVVENPVIIQFNSRTVFCKVAETEPPIPLHCFRLIQFAALETERKLQSILSCQAILTDVYGCIKSIRPPHPQFIRSQNKMGVKCEFVIENLGRESLTIVFWGKLARDLNVDEIISLPSPVLAVFTGLKIGEFDHRIVANNYEHTCLLLEPPTASTDAYKAEFSKPGDRIAILGDFHLLETDQPKNIVSVQVLSGLNPAEYNARSILCKGQILKFGTNGWWYRRCPETGCHKQCLKMEDIDNKYKCKVHGVRIPVPSFRVNTLIADEFSVVTVTIMGNQAEMLFGSKAAVLQAKRVYPTEQSIPIELSATIGQVCIFELKGNKYGEWTVVHVELPKEDVAITKPPTDKATGSASASAIVVPDLALQTPEKTNTNPKRTSSKIQQPLLTENKKTKRQSEEALESGSMAQDKKKLD